MPLYLYLPCGHCAECMQLKRDQWYLRNYWHSKECFDKGGYVFFDTLTYRDENLPHLSWWFPEFEGKSYDYACFCYEHYRNFMKRLRINLQRGVFEPDYIEIQELRKEKKNLKAMRKRYPLRKNIDKINNGPKRDWIESRITEIDYRIEDLSDGRKCWPSAKNINAFCVTEYGKDEYYMDDRGKMRKATFRPHYHLLFYVNIPDLPSVKLAEYIYKSWNKGKTDSVDAYGNLRTSYVRNHNTIGKDYSRNSELELRRVSQYVAKYVTKDADYSDRLRSRIQYAGERVGRVYEEYETELKGMPVTCMRLVRQQKDIDKIKRLIDGFHLQGLGFGLYALDPVNFDEEEFMEKGTMSMPDSKLIKKSVPISQYYLRHKCYDVVTPDDDWRVNSPTYVLNEYGKEYKTKFYYRLYNKTIQKYTDYLLNFSEIDRLRYDFLIGNRKVDDFVLYKLFYQNRFGTDVYPDLDSAISSIVSCDNRDGDIYVDDQYCVWQKDGYCFPDLKSVEVKWKVQMFDDFCKDNIIHDFSSGAFIWFDDIDELFNKYIKIKSEERQKLFDHKELMRKRIKGNK